MSADYAVLARALAPETALVVGALATLGLDLAGLRKRSTEFRLRAAVGVAMLAVVTAGGLVVAVGTGAEGGALRLDLLSVAVRLGVLVLALGALGVTTGGKPLRHPVEYVAVMLFATAGLTLMAAANQLLLAFLALELASLSLYVLTGFDKSRPESAEAALKYFLFGGMSAAFLLFGFSLLYGLTGSIDFAAASAVLAAPRANPLAAVALVMVLVAFGFKIAAAPFHLWAPDVYQGAPASSAALIASASKLAGYALFARLLWAGTTSGAPGWLPVLAVLAGASLLLGNLVALAQTNVRRLLAYSAVAHAGALLLGVMTADRFGFGPLVYYAATYGLASVGAFGVIAVVERSGGCGRLEDLAGLSRRSPLLAACLTVSVLSLAGIPPLAGFFGKFAVFAAALRFDGPTGPAGGLALLAIALTAVALYYYLLILKQALVAAPAAERGGRIAVPAPAAVTLVVAAGLIVLLGVFPSLVLGQF